MDSIRPDKNLLVWQEGIALVKLIYQVTALMPESEKFGLISQLRRAAVSVPTNIAEGAARNTEKEFLQFLHISRGSLSEIDTLILIAFELNFISRSDNELMVKQVDKLGALQNGLIKKLRVGLAK